MRNKAYYKGAICIQERDSKRTIYVVFTPTGTLPLDPVGGLLSPDRFGSGIPKVR